MENYIFKLNVNLETEEHTATVTIENIVTGEILQTKEFTGTSREHLMEQAQEIKAHYMAKLGISS